MASYAYQGRTEGVDEERYIRISSEVWSVVISTGNIIFLLLATFKLDERE